MKQKDLFAVPDTAWVPNGKPCPEFIERPAHEREREARKTFCYRCGYVLQLHPKEGLTT